jgi:asparaginyl-tRNA synthetase
MLIFNINIIKMKHTKVKDLLNSSSTLQEVNAKGWVRTFRNNQFIALNDGSTINNIQCVVDFENTPEETLKRITTGASVSVTGTLVESKGAGQKYEIQVAKLEILGDSDAEKFPMQPKKHSLEFLRENAHLRVRTNAFGAIMRVRSVLAHAVHTYFQEKGFVYVNTPIITGSDAEGAGEMFKVTALPFDNTPRNEEGKVDYKKDFFGKETNLTVSGQLEGETFAMALGQIYTFGPTFRAENSNTSRHLAEFWMIEPEVAFNDIHANMDLAEEMLKYICSYVMNNFPDDLKFLHDREAAEQQTKPQNERSEMGLVERLQFAVSNEFKRITYTEAIDVLRNSNHYKKKKFQYEVEWGTDLQSEHERFLVEKEYKRPVIITDYPASFKAFYMRRNDNSEVGRETVAAMDILFPGIGEMVGGSQREERLDVLREKCAAFHIPEEDLWWYLDTRKFGTVPHAGFGLGFERMVMFVTGMSNIRDVIPFPRTPQNAEF